MFNFLNQSFNFVLHQLGLHKKNWPKLGRSFGQGAAGNGVPVVHMK
jgi:hypothetical protein